MEESARGRTVEKYLYLSVLDFRGLRILGVFNALHGRPEPRTDGAVARVGVTAQAYALFRTLEIRQLGFFDPSVFRTTATFLFGGKIDETKDPIKNGVYK